MNECIAEAHDLLARTIGAHITLIAAPAPTPLTIYAVRCDSVSERSASR